MTDWVKGVLERYGQEVTVSTVEGTVSVRAFLQPVTEKTEQVPDDFGSLGWMDGRLWLYLGQTELATGDRVGWNGRTFRVRSCRPYYVGTELSHYWASLEAAKEAAS